MVARESSVIDLLKAGTAVDDVSWNASSKLSGFCWQVSLRDSWRLVSLDRVVSLVIKGSSADKTWTLCVPKKKFKAPASDPLHTNFAVLHSQARRQQ